jgi:hypothetical protein
MVKEIINHATKLAIRVVPEFDNPGHTRAIGLDPYFQEAVRCFSRNDIYELDDAYTILGTPHTSALDPSM